MSRSKKSFPRSLSVFDHQTHKHANFVAAAEASLQSRRCTRVIFLPFLLLLCQ
jgi:hypothetical protein